MTVASTSSPGVPSSLPPVRTVPGPQADCFRPFSASEFGPVEEEDDSRETV